MTRLSPPEPRTLADAAARWLEGGARPTAPTQGAVRPSLEVARLARRIAGADPLPGRPLVVLCDGHREEPDLVLAALASGRPTLLAPSTLPSTALARVRETFDPVEVVAACPSERHPGLRVAWDLDGPERELWQPDRDAPAIGTLTSGSTGNPRGFFRSQGSQLDQAVERVTSWPVSIEEDVYGHIGAASFTGSMNTLCMGVATGLRVVLGLATRLDGGGLRGALRRHGITFLSLTPTLLRHLTKGTPDGAGFEGVRTLNLSGEPVRASDVREFHRVAAGRARLRVSWGSTEAGTLTSGELEAGLSDQAGPLPVGAPMEGVEIAVVDGDGRAVEAGDAGRLIVRSPNLSVEGDRLERSFVRLEGEALGGSPWFDTGDEGWLARDGRVVVRGRVDGDLKVNGVRLDGADLEGRLARVEGVHEVAAVTLELEGGQALGVALTPDDAAVRDAVAAAAGELGSLQRRAVVEAFPSLPVNASGKTDRRAILRELQRRVTVRAEEDRDRGRPLTDTESLVADAWQAAFDIARPGAHLTLDDLGVDSVDRLRLLVELETRHGVALSPAAVGAALTVADIAEQLVPVEMGPGTGDRSPLVELRPGDGPLVCFLPGLGGHSWIFEPLARQLPDRTAALGLDWSRGVSAGRGAVPWLADRLQDRGGARPWTIVGFSAGAAIAWALAAEWRRRGGAPPNVVLLDGDPSFRERPLRALKLRLRRLLGIEGRADVGADPVAVRLEILRREGAAVLSTVRPRPGEPAATLVVTPTSPPHRIERWRRLCPQLTVRTIDRPHLELVRPPHDAALVQLLCETAASGDRARPGCEGAGPHG